jgi:uncharacterized protein YndB with AHSA1/START domain
MTLYTPNGTLVVKRVIAAPAEVIFDAWTDADSFATWMTAGPVTHAEATTDPRVGGGFTVMVHTPSQSLPHSGTYLVIDRPRRLSFTWQSPNTDDKETVVTVDFTEVDAGTEVAVTHEGLPGRSSWDAHSGGWVACLEALDRLAVARSVSPRA